MTARQGRTITLLRAALARNAGDLWIGSMAIGILEQLIDPTTEAPKREELLARARELITKAKGS